MEGYTAESAVSTHFDIPDDEEVEEEEEEKAHADALMAKRRMYKIIDDGVDRTPDDVLDIDFDTMDERFAHVAFQNKKFGKNDAEMMRQSTKSRLMLDSTKVYATTINLDDIHIDHTIDTEAGPYPADIDLEPAPSAFYLPKMNPLTSYPPEIMVTLKETETLFLFDLPSTSYDRGTPEGTKIEEENEYYLYITVGKGRNRKMVNEETQTKDCVSQTRHTLATRPKKKNASSFASMWDMHDTYAMLARQTAPEEEDEMVLYQSAAPSMLRKKKKSATHLSTKNKNFEQIGATSEYLDAVLLTERVLASLEYSNAQKMFRGLVQMDPLSLDLIYVYTLKPLWTLECEETEGKPVMKMAFNPKNPNILAVAHGKFAYAQNCKGILCVWCTKNPCKPERVYHFEASLTSLAFSEKNPNWLAVGFSNGDVMILDITSYWLKIIAKSKRFTNPCFEPMWVTSWRPTEKDGKYVMTTCEDGRINRFVNTKTHEFICSPMMRITTVEGKLTGLDSADTCLKVDVPIKRFPAVLCMLWHPYVSHVYYVGTDEGCIHKCSTHYLNQHIEVTRAHAGPIYSMSLSPFMDTLMVSCGADNAIRLWIEGMDEVIMTLQCQAAVYGAAFCPKNATIILSVSGNALGVWDLRRKIHMPCAEHVFPPDVLLTHIEFAGDGDNVFVGDTLGRIYTFHLEDTPIPPYYQRQLLDEAIKNALCTRPHVLKRLEKIQKFHSGG